MSLKFKVNFLLIIATILPPILGNVSAYLMGMGAPPEAGPAIGITSLFSLIPMFVVINKKLKHIINAQVENNIENAEKATNALIFIEKFFIIIYLLYNIIGPIAAATVYYDNFNTSIAILLSTFPQVCFVIPPVIFVLNHILEKNTATLGLQIKSPISMKLKLFILSVIIPLGASLLISYVSFVEFSKVQTFIDASKREELFTIALFTLIVANIVAVVGSLIIYTITVKVLYNPISAVIYAFKDLSLKQDGVMSKLPITTKDEIGELILYFNAFMDKLQSLIFNIKDISKKVNVASNEILNVSNETSKNMQLINKEIVELDNGIHVNAKYTEQLSSTVDEISNSTLKLSGNSDELLKISGISKSNVVKGKNTIDNAVNSMKIIYNSVKNSTDDILDFSNKSQEINAITSTISSIAQQTSLLSLNAAIEAARAGEAGKGFAVVAGEIKKLSQNTSDSIKVISEIVQNISVGSNRVVKQMEKNNLEIESGINTILSASMALDKIVDSYNEMSEKINELHRVVANEVSSINVVQDSINDVSSTALQQVQKSNNIVGYITEEEKVILTLSRLSNDLNDIISKLNHASDKIYTIKK